MRHFLWDIETVPRPEAELLALMPPPAVMPEDIKNPPEADLSKCPVYGCDEAKQDAWKQKKLADHAVATEAARSTWEERQIEAKQKFIDDAALSAVTGSVKLIGIRDYEAKVTHILVAGASKEQLDKIGRATYPSIVSFHWMASERDALHCFAANVNSGAVTPRNLDHQSAFKLIGFYTHGFDLPFIFRRCWIMGAAVPWSLRKGRYFNDSVSLDLQELWKLGDNQVKTGGMDELAKVLGTKRKAGSGERFYALWESDPVGAILYLLGDLDATEEMAVKMGCVYVPMKGEK